MVAAVGTGGASPVLAQMLKEAIASKVPEGAGRVAALLRQFREETLRVFPDMKLRAEFLRGVLSGPAAKAASDGDMDLARTLLSAALKAANS